MHTYSGGSIEADRTAIRHFVARTFWHAQETGGVLPACDPTSVSVSLLSVWKHAQLLEYNVLPEDPSSIAPQQ